MEHEASQRTKIGMNLGFLNNGIGYESFKFSDEIDSKSGDFIPSNIEK